VKNRPIAVLCGVLYLVFTCPVLSAQVPGPQPGDVYKEYTLNLKVGNNWRVTDPDAKAGGAQDFLPNPVMTFQVDDLEGAVRAEALFDIWGGHPGTTDKRFRMNGNEWIGVPDHPTIPEDPECYYSEFNYIFEIPLDQLQEGDNTLEGTSGGQTCFDFGWGQWGWYVMILRIYYSPDKAGTTGSIISHPSGSVITEPDTIVVDASSPAGIKRVELLGRYRGYDENGDGIFTDWHRNYHTTALDEHIGSSTGSPHRIIWDNRWIPDQQAHAISLVARICDNSNVWFVTEIVDSISLVRPEGVSVKMFTAENIPGKFGVRAGQTKSCDIQIDQLTGATNARIYHRTWNGQDGGAGSGFIKEPLSVNSWKDKVGGANHNYRLSIRKVPVEVLLEGKNVVSYSSQTSHHGIEILWPGPALLVRYNQHASTVATPVIHPDSGEYRMPLEVSITCGTPDASVYYTADGTRPQIGDNRYLGPFELEDSAIIHAIAVKFDHVASEVSRQKYTRYLFPELVRAYKGAAAQTVEVDFNKPVEKSSAEVLSNYSLVPDGIITAARLDTCNPVKVILSVSGMTEGREYTLTVNNILDLTGTPVPSNSTSSFTYAYRVEVTASDQAGEHLAGHTMDNDLTTYWSALGTQEVWIRYDLGTTRLVQSVGIAFFMGDTRKNYFTIQTSTDGINWNDALEGESSGTTLEIEHFDVEDVMARYVRILGLGNSNSNWNSYTEVQIYWEWETTVPDVRRDHYKIFPVPARDEIYIGHPAVYEATEIRLIDICGKYSHVEKRQGSYRLSTDGLAGGIYVIAIPGGERVLNRKIIVAR